MNLNVAFEAPASAIVLAEGEFGETGGKTANGVVMHSELFDVRAVIDSESAGESAQGVLGVASAPDAPVVASLAEALEIEPAPEALIIGVAPVGGSLPEPWIETIQSAMAAGCNVVSGLHIFLDDDPEWRSLADENGVRIFDVRKPPADETLRVADGRNDDLDARVVLVMGTDCAVGKRTTTFELYKAAIDRGIDAGWVATGQTGIMVGAQRGVVIDRVPADFTAGVVEDLVCEVAADHDVVFVEGQASLTHRAYSGVTLSILHGSWPDAVVLADDPQRRSRTHFEQFNIEGITAEQALIEQLSDADVVAVSTWGDAAAVTEAIGLPAGNIYDEHGTESILDPVVDALQLERMHS